MSQPQAATVLESAAGAAVQTVALGKRIDDRRVLRGIDLTVARGEFVALLGANGAGKTTLLKVLSTLTPPSEGELHLFGESMKRGGAKLRAKIGLIGHQSMLYRDLSARENLEFFGKLYGLNDPAARADELLDAVGLWERGDDLVKTFSRGMTQRVAIARALVHDPELLLADEPFDGLDAPSVRTVETFLGDLHASGKTVILVNHDIGQSLRLAQRAVVLRSGQVAVDRRTAELDDARILYEMERGDDGDEEAR